MTPDELKKKLLSKTIQGTANTLGAIEVLNVTQDKIKDIKDIPDTKDVEPEIQENKDLHDAHESAGRVGTVSQNPNDLLGILRPKKYVSSFLPEKPAEGFVCFRSNHKFQQFFTSIGTQIVVENHFIVTDDEEKIDYLDLMIKHTGTLFRYTGPWA